MMCMHDVSSLLASQIKVRDPLIPPDLHHMVRDRRAAIGHITRQASDVLLCPSRAHTYTHTYIYIHTYTDTGIHTHEHTDTHNY